MIDLSICILSLPARIDSYARLVSCLNKQIVSGGFEKRVEILSFTDSKTFTVGQKRNMLKDLAIGRYICFADDDDGVSEHYIRCLLYGIDHNPDVVTFMGYYIKDGENKIPFSITQLHGNNNTPKMIYRLPNHLCAVKSIIAKQCSFPNMNYREDSDYAENINKKIKNEYHLKEYLYTYFDNPKESQTQNPDANAFGM